MNGPTSFIAKLEQCMPYVQTVMGHMSSFGIKVERLGLASLKRSKVRLNEDGSSHGIERRFGSQRMVQ